MEPVIIKPEKELKTVGFIVWWIVFVPVTTGLVLLALLIPDQAGRYVFTGLLLLYWVIMGLWAKWIPAYFKTLEYKLDDDGVKMGMGVFWKKRVTVPYTKITNVDVTQGPLQRKYGIGTVHVQTAGAGGAQGGQAELRMAGIRDFDNIKDVIMEKVKGTGEKRLEDSGKEPLLKNDSLILSRILNELIAIRQELQNK